MIKIYQNCYLVPYEEDNKFLIGSIYMGQTIVSLELYDDGNNNKYIKITTYPINFKI